MNIKTTAILAVVFILCFIGVIIMKGREEMNITQRQSPNRAVGRQGQQTPDYIVLHTTGGSFTSAINTIMNPANQVSYHFVIARNGDIVQAVDIENTAWANGTRNDGGNMCNSRSTIADVRNRRVNANSFTVSIGFGDMPAGNPSMEQLAAAVDLIRHIANEVRRIYGHTIPFARSHIVGHNEITPVTRPNCPGRAFPYDELLRRLNKPRAVPAVPPQPPAPETPPRTVSLDILGEVQEIGGYIENGATWVRLTEFATALGFTATWDGQRRIPVIGPAGTVENNPHMNAVDEKEVELAAENLRLLKVITHWEARGEDEKGQILVVNVINNRLADPRHPNTLREVIFHPNAFTPTQRADFDTAQPNARTVTAVHRAINGEDFSQGATFFHSISGIRRAEREGREVWHERAVREGRLIHLFDHGNHRFYREA